MAYGCLSLKTQALSNITTKGVNQLLPGSGLKITFMKPTYFPTDLQN